MSASIPDQPAADRDFDLFRETLSQPEEGFPLFQASLLISALHYPNLHGEWWLHWHELLADIVREARLTVSLASPERQRLEQLAEYFSTTLGFGGATENYQDPDNICLITVMARRRGLPITLSVLFITVGKRLGLPLYGVGAPAHFLVGGEIDGERIFVDPFSGPDVMNLQEACRAVAMRSGLSPTLIEPFMRPSAPLEILARMLNNLKIVFAGNGQLEKLLRTLTWLLAVEPDNLRTVRDRGLVLLRLGKNHEGAKDLLRYLHEARDVEDLDVIRAEAERALKTKGQH